jgi:diguanylate cyclase (GGDEF)-like protein
MNSELPFVGFRELIQEPLAASDQRSFSLIKRFLIENQVGPAQPFTVLLQKLTGKVFANDEAIVCWKQIIKHKVLMQQKLGRTVGIQTAAIDYFEYQSPVEILFRLPSQQTNTTNVSAGEVTESLYTQGYHLEKLKEEILRAKRYKHALSVIMLNIENFHTLNETLNSRNSDKVLTTIVNIIKKTIRTVDFLCRLSEDRFFLILPNTNQREARELAERIRVQIYERTGRLSILSDGVTATLSVGQCSHTDSSIDFVRRIERVLDEGRLKCGNGVFSIN